MSGYWMTPGGAAWVHRNCGHDANCRPVVVIDPEDDEQAKRLADALREAPGKDDGYTTLGTVLAALRSLIAPPKPPEPKGLGAVVEDRWGHRFVYTAADGYPWWNANEDQSCSWSAIAAVKVLSEGVTA